jgi:Ca2+-binding EF-hand superfamily protein
LIRVFTLYEAESIEDEEKDEEDEEEEEEENEDDESLQISSSVDKRHLFAGMSVFCGYSKSVKLGSLFKLFDFVGDGFLTRRMFFDMLKSILSVLFAFSGLGANRCHANDTSSTNNWSTTSAAERAAGAVVSKVFSESRRVHADAISLTEFAQWYAQGGYLTCSWLELLDLSKWPAKEAFEASKKEKPLIYAFDMLEEGSILQFTKSDIATYLYMLRMTKLKEQPVNKIYDALMSYATPPIGDERGRGGHGGNAEGHEPGKAGNSYSYAAIEEDEGAYLVITRQNFYNCIRSLVPRGEMSDKAQQTSSKLLSRMFNVYDRKRCGRVNALELACGLSIIGLGSKSQKLAMAFNFITKLRQQRSRVLNSQYTAAYMTGNGTLKGLHDPGDEVTFLSQGNVKRAGVPHAGEASDELASLPHSVLFIYLRSFLLVLMSLSDSTYRLGLEKIYVEADDFIEEAMGDIMTEVAANGPGGGGNGPISVRSRARVTFQQFGEWYNNGGYELISWLELLDVSKWQQQQDFEEQTMNRTGQKSIHGRQNPHPHPEKQKNQQMSADGMKKRESNDKESPQKAKPSSPKKIDATDINSARKGNKKGKKTIRQSAICLLGDGPPAGGAPPPQKKSITELEEEKNENALAALSLASDGPIMVYAISHRNPVAELQFYNDDIDRLKLFQQQTHIHKVEALTFLANLRLASNALIGTSSSRDVVFSRDAFGGFFQKACTISIHSKSPVQVTEEGLELLNSIEEVFLKDMADVEDQEHKEDEEVVEFMKAACGMIVLTKDKLLEKLQAACGFYVNRNANATTNNKADSKAKEKKKNKKAGFTSPMSANDTTTISIAQQVPIEDFKQVLSYFLMALYAISCSLSNEVIRHSSTIGAGELVDFFLENQKEKLKPDNINIGDFTTWFWEEGSQKYPWLELVNTFEWPPKVATIRLKDAQLKRTGISG